MQEAEPCIQEAERSFPSQGLSGAAELSSSRSQRHHEGKRNAEVCRCQERAKKRSVYVFTALGLVAGIAVATLTNAGDSEDRSAAPAGIHHVVATAVTVADETPREPTEPQVTAASIPGWQTPNPQIPGWQNPSRRGPSPSIPGWQSPSAATGPATQSI
ncbi:hypothetical protein [Streptomyces sp. IMTB 1903]|uniref:hypothetical protein n=1 Tax=Streptomyces sp. IMTB 1903 TaxID=1776680 RepID=UPI00131DC096|nr:hypothetical protein [Streptomyces sp. IMTB 1903]